MVLVSSVLTTASLIAAYVLLEWVSFIHEYKGVPITPWNPGLGLVFGFIVLFGARFAAVLFRAQSSPRLPYCAAIFGGPSSSDWPRSSRWVTGSSPKWRAPISGSMPGLIGCAMLSYCWSVVWAVQL